jgi:simple sugar transport system substrate-binding protein
VGIEQASMTGKVQLGSFDMNDTCLERIKGGTQLYAIDQQPWLQGFLAVVLADAYVNYGLKLATAPILTGPGVVDSSNIDATLAGAKAGYR